MTDDLPNHVGDQIEAARRQTDQWYEQAVAAGGRQHPDMAIEQLPPALRRVVRRFEAGLERSVATGRMCPHKDPQRAQPTHLFASQPDLRLCERCAAPILDAGANTCDLCRQLCYPTLVHYTRGYLMFHAALCDDCYPEGADAPRVE